MKWIGTAAFVLAFALQGARAQRGVTWQVVPSGPSARFATNLAYDASTRKVVLFGGTGIPIFPPVPVAMQDTWEWDGTWNLRTPASSPPAGPCRLLYHAALGGVVAFTSSGPWLWNGVNWSSLGGPAQPLDHNYAYDSARQIVVRVGALETWEWNMVTWSRRATTGPWGGPMAYDESRGTVVLWEPAATWEWNGVSWTRHNPTTMPFSAPPTPGAQLASSQAVFDAGRRRVIQHGAWGDFTNGNILGTETWEWDGSNWSRISTGGPGRHGLMMAYHATYRLSLVYGGSSNWLTAAQPVMETLTLSSVSPADFASYGTGCPGSAGPLSLGPAPFSMPWIGDTFTVEIGGLPAGCLPWLLIGFASTSLPVAGCTQLTSAETAMALTLSGNRARQDLPIPASLGATVVGRSLYYQGAALLAGGANPLGVAASGGGRAILGLR